MNRTIFWRLMWKEYRTQRAFWICILLLTLALMGLACLSMPVNEVRDRWQFGLALLLPALFAVGCGATLFAAEYEGGTYEFQRSLPLRSKQLLLAKGTFAILSTGVMYSVTWCAAVFVSQLSWVSAIQDLPAWALSGRLPGPSSNYAPGAISVTFAVELFLWSTLFSLLLRRPLTAAVAGAVAAALSVELMTWIVLQQYTRVGYAAALPLRTAVAAILVLVDIWFGLRWLDDGRIASTPRLSVPGQSAQRPIRIWKPSGAQIVARLIWENWRQSRGLLLALTAMFVPLAVTILRYAIRRGTFGDFWNPDTAIEQVDLLLFTLLALAIFPSIGAVTFLWDQQGHGYRFLADRGVRAGHVWLGRQIPAWVVTALFAVIGSVAAAECAIFSVPKTNWQDVTPLGSMVNYLVLSVASIALLGFTTGQFFSMLFRNVFLSAFFSLLLTCVLALWYGLMLLWRINWFWSVLPIALALLLASRLRAPHWLVERNTLRAWLPVGLTLTVPAVILLTVVPLYRAYQIPDVGPGFSPDEYARRITAAEHATNDLYDQASRQVVFVKEDFEPENPADAKNDRSVKPRRLTPHDIAWVDANPKAIATILAASRNENDNFTGRDGNAWQLANLAVLSAMRSEEQGNLDAAMDRYLAALRISVQLRRFISGWQSLGPDKLELQVYELLPYWAARPKQTPQRILAAAREIHDLTDRLPPDSDEVKREYIVLRHTLSGGYSAMIERKRLLVNITAGLEPMTAIWSQLPWERTRAVRLLNLLTQRQLIELAGIELAAAQGGGITQPRHESRDQPEEFPYALFTEINVPPIHDPRQHDQDERIRSYTAIVATRRGVRLSLLLEAWKLRHGGLPKTLDELVGPDLDHVPIDPYTGTRFRYVREGAGEALRWLGGEIAAGVPFVWSAGPRVEFYGLRDGRKEPSFSDYGIVYVDWTRDPYLRTADSDYDVWQASLPIPVP